MVAIEWSRPHGCRTAALHKPPHSRASSFSPLLTCLWTVPREDQEVRGMGAPYSTLRHLSTRTLPGLPRSQERPLGVLPMGPLRLHTGSPHTERWTNTLRAQFQKYVA